MPRLSFIKSYLEKLQRWEISHLCMASFVGQLRQCLMSQLFLYVQVGDQIGHKFAILDMNKLEVYRRALAGSVTVE